MLPHMHKSLKLLCLLIFMTGIYILPTVNASDTTSTTRGLENLKEHLKRLVRTRRFNHPPANNNNNNIPRNIVAESTTTKALKELDTIFSNMGSLQCGIYGVISFPQGERMPYCSKGNQFPRDSLQQYSTVYSSLSYNDLYLPSIITEITDTDPGALMVLGRVPPSQRGVIVKDLVALNEQRKFDRRNTCKLLGDVNCYIASTTRGVVFPTIVPEASRIRFYLDWIRRKSISSSLTPRDALPQMQPGTILPSTPTPTPTSYTPSYTPSTEIPDEELKTAIYSIVESVFPEEWQTIYEKINAGTVKTVSGSELNKVSKTMRVEGPFENEYFEVKYATPEDFQRAVNVGGVNVVTGKTSLLAIVVGVVFFGIYF
ncbi:hypothetical protein TWF506_005032 [Arthrobotrys conoides]|uniref:Uncharacterized protein n=1 Tax=Arthrobotrys conoides TaxID=74498 RepID=A0AAN8S2E7_9PEZI